MKPPNHRYWRKIGAHNSFAATNRHGLEIEHCNRLAHYHGRPYIRCDNLEPAEDYTLRDIHSLAYEECFRTSRGDFIGFEWTKMLCHYSFQPKFRAEVFELGPLAHLEDPKDPTSVLQILYNRFAEYRAHYSESRTSARHGEAPTPSSTSVPAPRTGSSSGVEDTLGAIRNP